MCDSQNEEYEVSNKALLERYCSLFISKINGIFQTERVPFLCHYTNGASLCSLLQGKNTAENIQADPLRAVGCPSMLAKQADAEKEGCLTGEFWFTKWNCLNDPTEFRLIHDSIEEELKIYDNEENADFYRLMTSCNSWDKYTKRDIAEDWGHFMHEHDVFIASFTQNDDLLNMWSRYANAESADGYSITFDEDCFERSDVDYTIEYAKVVYDVSQQNEIISCFLKELNKIYNSPEMSAEDERERTLIIFNLFDVIFSKIAGFIKHCAYKDEAEVRALLRLTQSGRKLIRYRAMGGIIIPYVPVPYDICKIKRVRISPALKGKCVIPGLRSIRSYNSLSFEILESHIPYRQ